MLLLFYCICILVYHLERRQDTYVINDNNKEYIATWQKVAEVVMMMDRGLFQAAVIRVSRQEFKLYCVYYYQTVKYISK